MSRERAIFFYFLAFIGIFIYNQFLSGQVNVYSNFIQSIIQSFLSFTILAMGFYFDIIMKYYDGLNKNRKINTLINEFNSFFEKNTLIKINTEINKEIEISRVNIFRELINKNFNSLNNDESNSLILISLIFNYDRNKNEEVFRDIQIFSDVLGISNLQNESKIFLTAYNRICNNKWNIDMINKLIYVDNTLDFKKLAIDYCKKYSLNNLFNLYEEDFTKSKEFRRALHELIFTGKLTTIILSNDLKKRIEENRKYSKTYLIIGQKLGDKFSSYVKKMPKISGVLWSGNLPGKKGKIFSTYIVKPNKEYTIEKLMQIYKSKIDKTKESLICIIPLDNNESQLSSHNNTFTFSNSNLTESYEILKYFKTFFDYSDYEIWKEISKNQTAIEELLSIIPFNIYFDDLTDDERSILVSNYLQLKQHFGIDTIFDWKNVNPQNLATILGQLQFNGINISTSRCVNFARRIVQKSAEFYNALN